MKPMARDSQYGLIDAFKSPSYYRVIDCGSNIGIHILGILIRLFGPCLTRYWSDCSRPQTIAVVGGL